MSIICLGREVYGHTIMTYFCYRGVQFACYRPLIPVEASKHCVKKIKVLYKLPFVVQGASSLFEGSTKCSAHLRIRRGGHVLTGKCQPCEAKNTEDLIVTHILDHARLFPTVIQGKLNRVDCYF